MSIPTSRSPGVSVDASEVPAPALGAFPPPDDLRYVARQPILDARGNLHGYELLFRSGPTSVAFSGDGNAATRSVLDNGVVFGAERLTGNMPMFVNCTAEALLGGLVLVLPPEYTVLELLESLEPTPSLLQACCDLKERGYRLALDDFEWDPAWMPLLEIADYVKVDLSRTSHEQRVDLLEKLRKYSLRLVLERVETPADLELGRSEGFTLFQGYYFCRPVVMENRAIPSNRMLYLEMLHALQDEPIDVQRMSDLVKRDASLTYRLLRMVNSPLYATRKVVSSIRGALVLIGDAMFRRVVTLAIASELCGHFPSELLQMAFLRGRFCELAAPLLHQDPTEQYLLGILSLFPAIMKVPMSSIAESMPLRGEIRHALMGEANGARTLLSWIESYEAADWESCDKVALSVGLPLTALPGNYADALLWADAVMSVNAETAV